MADWHAPDILVDANRIVGGVGNVLPDACMPLCTAEGADTTITTIPISAIPESTTAGIIMTFMACGAIPREEAEAFLARLAAKDDKAEDKKAPKKKK